MAAVAQRNGMENEISENLYKVRVPPKSTNPVNEEGLSECFRVARTSMYVSIAPCHIANPINGIKEQHLDPLVMKYFAKARGVVLGYSNIVINSGESETNEENQIVAPVSDLSPFAFMWITVDLLLWTPQIGDTLKGFIYMLTATHLGLLVHDTFNAHIRFRYIPQDWEFVPNQADEFTDSNTEPLESGRSNFRSYGHWVDHNGLKVEGKIPFTIRSIHTSGKMISLEGTLVSPERELDAQPVHENNEKSESAPYSAAVASGSHIKFDSEPVAETPEPAKSQEDGMPGYVNTSDSSDSE
ncbi:hypothetical protein PUMCH_003823 [Australozyma saopauloensis]|uniref:DNA-directed RNA polymerase subunit n=1 Tax=Australozyma saopauloensis TaxID=291208 RepID=A0AAX4HDF5_9ASCO|nr:hypothetical protein PUMCH_003823 [[Candida] saopauloensis]